MKICRFTLRSGSSAAPRLGVVDAAGIRDVTEVVDELPPLRWPLPVGDQFIANLGVLLPRMEVLARAAPVIARDAVNLLSPVANPAKFVCGVGNWNFHGIPLGTLGFLGKVATCLTGPDEGIQIRWPDRTTVYEPELATIIGRQCTNVSEAQALDYVAGYACGFDTTLQPEKEDWAFCKSFDTYGTLGPWLVTADEIPDPSALGYTFRVDGELRGERQFADLTASPAQLIAYVSSMMTLYPGDIILSGAADVAPIHPSETLEMDIPGIGTMSVKVMLSPHARAGA